MIQSQKRALIKDMLDCAIARMLEYKRDIVDIDFTEYEWPDNLLNLMKMTPNDVALKAPAYYVVDRKDLLSERQTLIDNIINEESISDFRNPLAPSSTTVAFGETKVRRNKSRFASKIQAAPVILESPEQKAAREERAAQEAKARAYAVAIILIQSHERTRIARRIGAVAEKKYHYNLKLMLGMPVKEEPTQDQRLAAAIMIQKHVRGFLTRRTCERKLKSIENLLEMSVPSWKSREIMKKAEENLAHRSTLQYPHVLRVEEATALEKSRILKIRGPGMVEDITDEIREWFILWYNELGFFDVFPAAEAGGSILIVTGETLSPEEYLIQKLQEGKPGEQKTEDKKENNSGEEPKKTPKYKMKDTKILPFLADANEDFVANWSLRLDGAQDEDINFELIRDKLCHELQMDIRKTVDDLMRLELDKLNQALRKDHAEDMNFEVPTKSTAQNVTIAKKQKERKNPLPNEHIEDIFKELVHLQVIRNYPEAHLSDWIGDLSYQNYEAGREFRDYHHRLGEIVQLIMEYCILPLGSKRIHELAPLVKSVAICGPPMYGKSFLANAVCSELGALLLDLTPDRLEGQFEDKESLKRLVATVTTVARAYAPAIIFIDGGEKPWLKKVPEELKGCQPKKYGPIIKKIVSGIKAGDQVLFLTISSLPRKAAKPYVKIHNKFIFIPVTDYGTMYIMYKNLLMQYHGVDRNLDVSCLAKVSAGLPLEVVRNAIEETLTADRRMTLKFRPLDPQEIFDKIMEYKDPAPKAIEDLKKFQASTPIEKKRLKMLKQGQEERAKQAKQAGKK